MAQQCKIVLLGGLQVIHEDGTVIDRFRTRKGALLLARLALEQHQTHSRERLGEWLWPETPSLTQRARLRYELSSLRSRLQFNIFETRDKDSLALSPQVTTDISILRNALCEKRWQDAIALYKTDLLPTLYDSWATLEQDHLREEMREAYLHALHELYEGGHSGKAQVLLHQFRIRFPEEETNLSALRPDVPVPPSPSLPALPIGNFFGREAEWKALYKGLTGASANPVLLTIVGPGGTGKTRLALETAHRLAALNPIRWIAYVPLETLEEPERFAEIVLRTLLPGEKVATSPEVAQRQLAEFLLQCPGTQPLLILDNFEHIAAGAASQVARLLGRCLNLQCLITSRQPLHLRNERILRLAPLSVPDRANEPNAEESASVCLFIERALAAQPCFAPSRTDYIEIVAICRLLDGIPLAIEIAAARMGMLSISQIRTALEKDCLDPLAIYHRDAPRRHLTLRSTLEWSWRLLSVPERDLLARLSVFEGGFSQEAVQFAFNAVDLLESLCQHALVIAEPVPPDDAIRFRLLGITRAFAAEKLPPKARSQAHEAHARYFRGLVTQADDGLRGDQEGEWVRRLEREQPNLRAALNFTLADANTRRPADDPLANAALRFVDELYLFYYLSGQAKEGLRWLQTTIAAVSEVPPCADLAAAHRTLGVALLELDSPNAAEPSIRCAMKIIESLEYEHWARTCLILAWRTLGRIHLARGEWEAVRHACAIGITFCETFNPMPNRIANLQAFLWREIGQSWVDEGYPEQAAFWCRKTMDYWQQRGWIHHTDIADSLALLAWIDLSSGRLEQASLRLEDAFERLDRVGTVGSRPHLLYLRSQIAAQLGNRETAVRDLRQAYDEAEASGDYSVQIRTLEALAIVALARREGGESIVSPNDIARLWGRAQSERGRRHLAVSIPESVTHAVFLNNLKILLPTPHLEALFQSGELLFPDALNALLLHL